MFSKQSLSIDIRENLIKFTQGKLLSDNNVKVTKSAYLDMKNIVIKGGEDVCFQSGRILNCKDSIEIIKSFVKKHKFKNDKVLLSISDSKIIMRVVKLPRIPLNDLESLIQMEVPNYFPVDLSKYYIDFRVLSEYNFEDKVFYKILICAIPKNIIREYTDLLIKVGFKPILIDVHENSISRLFKRLEFEDIAIVDGSINKVDLIILNRGDFYIHTTLEFDFINYNDLYRNEPYNIELIEKNLLELISNVKNYINFYLSKNDDKNIDNIYITGDLGMLTGVEEKFHRELGIESFKGFNKLVKVTNSTKQTFDENFYSANIGMLLRGE